jgi:hypothetical protein
VNGQQQSWWRDLVTMPFIETVVSAILGGVIAAIDQKWSSALIALAIGLILSFSRLAFTQTLKRKLSPLSRLCRLVDINRQVQYPRFLEIVNVYSQILEPEFQRVKDAVVEDAAEHLRQLAQQKRSRELGTGEYYLWLSSMLEKQVGGEVWAVSLLNPLEWVDSAAEKKFLQLNKDAVARGVKLTRVFIVDKDKVADLKSNSGIAWHFSTPGVQPYIAIREEIVKTDPKLLSELGDGFIAFDYRVAMIDVFSTDGTARGYVTTNSLDIQTLHGRFDELTKTFGELHDGGGHAGTVAPSLHIAGSTATSAVPRGASGQPALPVAVSNPAVPASQSP